MLEGHVAEAVAGAAVAITVAAKAIVDHYKGKRRDRAHGATLNEGFGKIHATLNERFAETNAAVAEVRAFCVGPDGQNGFRKDISDLRQEVRTETQEIRTRLDGVETRERERLEREVGRPDRRKRA